MEELLRDGIGLEIRGESSEVSKFPRIPRRRERLIQFDGSSARACNMWRRYSSTREMTTAMKWISKDVYEFTRRYFKDDPSVTTHHFNHMTVLFYYRKGKGGLAGDARARTVLGYHTDNIYSRDGSFSHSLNSQMENTLT